MTTNEDNIQELRAKLADRCDELMDASRYLLSKSVNDELFDTLDEHIQASMLACALGDYLTDYKGMPFGDGHIDEVLNDKEPALATGLYIYCNWRVWATHMNDESLAQKYQEICDKIDERVFKEWSKDKIDYFVRATD